MSAGDSDLRVRPGRIRGTRAPKPKSFINQVLRAAKKAGLTSSLAPAGKRSSSYGRSTFGRGRISFSRNRLLSPARRVVVKARVVRHQGRSFRSAPLTAHLSYLKRDGVSRNSEKAVMFDNQADIDAMMAYPASREHLKKAGAIAKKVDPIMYELRETHVAAQ